MSSEPAPTTPPRHRRFLQARGLVVLGSIVLVVAVLATWIRAQILDTNGWTQTSVRLLQNEQIRQVIANDLSERLLNVVDVQDLAAEKLPPALRALAPALSTAASQVVPKAVDDALAQPAVQTLWAHTNRLAHARVIEMLNGGGKTLSTSGGAVTLNVEALLDQIGQRLGVGNDVGAKLPANRRTVLLLRSNQLRAAQDLVKALRGLSLILPLLVALMYAGALALSSGSRRRILLEIGVGILAGSLLTLLLRRWVESYVVNGLVRDEGARPPVRGIFEIATAGWRERALWLLLTGVLALFAGWLAGPMGTAVRLRGFVATPLERHPGWFVAGVIAVVLLIASLGPARTPGQALPLLLELALAILGVLCLRRRSSASEQPAINEAYFGSAEFLECRRRRSRTSPITTSTPKPSDSHQLNRSR
jgi:hypothetical protein